MLVDLSEAEAQDIFVRSASAGTTSLSKHTATRPGARADGSAPHRAAVQRGRGPQQSGSHDGSSGHDSGDAGGGVSAMEEDAVSEDEGAWSGGGTGDAKEWPLQAEDGGADGEVEGEDGKQVGAIKV
jgi:hypothetical protein